MRADITRWQSVQVHLNRVAGWTVLMAFAAQLSACVSIEEIVPPVDASMAAMGTDLGYGMQTLSQGRHVYLNQCIDCHSPEPINRYSQDEWEFILPEMAAESKLDDGQRAALRAYVLVAYQAMTREESTEARRHEGTEGLDRVRPRTTESLRH